MKWSYAVPNWPGRYWWQPSPSDRAFEVKLSLDSDSVAVMIDRTDREIVLTPGSRHGRWCVIEGSDQSEPWDPDPN